MVTAKLTFLLIGTIHPIDIKPPGYLLCYPSPGCFAAHAASPGSRIRLYQTANLLSRSFGDCTMKKQKLGSGVGFGRRTMRVEHLEGRCMLAGNVSVSVDGAGDLLITGDNNDNAVLVQQVGEHDYLVTG